MKWPNKITEFLWGIFALLWFFTGSACVLFGLLTPDPVLLMIGGVLILTTIFYSDGI